MKSFVSFKQEFENFLPHVVASHELHAKWLNTLSYLENCGARKIAACEHPTMVKEEMLKHAAEEFRHALHLKRQIGKISSLSMETYALSKMFGGIATLHYLKALDVQVARYLKRKGFEKNAFKEAAYLLVTYAIERRAEELYPIYDQVLQKAGSRIGVKAILLEEKEHLQEMEDGIKNIADGEVHAAQACALESALCQRWLDSLLLN